MSGAETAGSIVGIVGGIAVVIWFARWLRERHPPH